VLHRGELLAWVSKTGKQLLAYLPESEPERRRAAGLLAGLLLTVARSRLAQGDSELLEQIDGAPAEDHVLLPALLDAGFEKTVQGLRVKAQPRAFVPRRDISQNSSVAHEAIDDPTGEPPDAPFDESIEDEIERELREAGLPQE
jgi:hypothetical protein